MRHFLPRFYVEGFVDPEERAERVPAVWIHRSVTGAFEPAPVTSNGMRRHFNEVDEAALDKNEDLEVLLAGIEDEAGRLITGKLTSRTPLIAAERDVLASLFALLGIRLSSRFADLDEREARRGYEELLVVLR